MTNRVPSQMRWQILYLVAAFFFHALIVYWATTRQQERLHFENGWLENLQVLYLALAAAVFAVNGKVTVDRHRVLFYWLSMVSLLFIIREVEFGDLAIPAWMKFMLAGAGRAVFYVIAIALFITMCRQFREYWCSRRFYLHSSLFWYLAASGFFLLAFSLTLDRQFFDITHYQLLEEASEAIAYVLWLGAALFGSFGIKRSYPFSAIQKHYRSGDNGLELPFQFDAGFQPPQKHNR